MKTIRHSALRFLAVLITSALAQTALDAGQSPTAVSARPCRVVNDTQGRHFPPDSGQALEDAIAAANPDDELHISGICRGTYELTQNIRLIGVPTRQFPTPTLDGEEAGTTLRISSRATATLTGLTITGGNSAGPEVDPIAFLGGGIDNNGNLTLISCVVIGNSAPHPREGGGILNRGSLVLREGSIVSGNVAGDEGGGISNSGVAVIASSMVVGNIAGFSGAIAGFGGAISNGHMLTIDASTITGNVAEFGAGAIRNTGTLIVRNTSTVSYNRAPSAGGILNHSILTVDSSTVNGNTASDSGGGIANIGGIATVNASTVSGNEGKMGGGIYNDNNGATTLNLSLVTTNRAVIAGGGIYNASGIVTLNSSDVTENIPDNCVGVPGC
ncbi:MAG TPA: hypothetical protein VFU28_05725 [Vicinamibacterales bacterium]|nr:hypothetical protein [Vicinamibacterales bacterium]